ncbi:hypothetical protein SAMN05444395_102276 [Flavobacterium fryxellicola]|nr:hypothetical protein SAMN05444395_102276 [Flavobacterium fryxellicola]
MILRSSYSAMKKYFLLSLSFILMGCQQESNSLTALFSLPTKLKEVSGITYVSSTNLLWILEDRGNPNAIYGINSNGKIEKTITIEDTNNVDWEDITKDKEGNLYIGDFGNNDNDRKDLSIYKIDKNALQSESVKPVYKISFTYPEQKDFPPKKSEMFYDVEGFFEFKDNFYLFTKNRSKGFDGTAFLYKIPNAPGVQEAVLMGEFKTCTTYNSCAITSATISPNEEKVAILTHDKLFLFENFKNDDFLNGTKTVLELNHFSQKEAACFKDNGRLFLADERTKSSGGNVYYVSLKMLKSKS